MSRQQYPTSCVVMLEGDYGRPYRRGVGIWYRAHFPSKMIERQFRRRWEHPRGPGKMSPSNARFRRRQEQKAIDRLLDAVFKKENL